eukprot:gene4565-5688_t
MSGGNRCNVLPLEIDVNRDYFSSDPKKMRHILKSWNVKQCYQWLTEEIGLKLSLEEESNKYFPVSDSAREVRDLLLKKCIDLGVEIEYNRCIDGLEIVESGDHRFKISGHDDKDSSQRFQYHSDRVILCTGGLSFPAIGTDGAGFKISKRLGVAVNPTFPALTPLKGPHMGGEFNLPGVSLNARVWATTTSKKSIQASRSGFLFTHKGYSGPSILDLSHYCIQSLDQQKKQQQHKDTDQPLTNIYISWDGEDKDIWKERLSVHTQKYGSATSLVSSRIKQFIPASLGLEIVRVLGLENKKIGEMNGTERDRLLEYLCNYKLPFTYHEGYRKAEVTGGGVNLDELDLSTLECKKIQSMFYCGEIIDAFGRIGGFNFYWAFVTGRLSGLGSIK